MKKNVKRLIISASVLAAVFLSVLFCKNNPAFVTAYFSPSSKWLTKTLSAFCSVFPFSVGELMIALAIAFGLYLIFRLIFRKIKLFSFITTLILTLSIILAYYFFSWGLNYYALPLEENINIETKKYTKEELFEAATYYVEKANEYSALVPRDSNGVFIGESFKEINSKTISAYSKLSKDYPFFESEYYPAKGFLSSGIFIRFDITGMYTPYSGEANVVLNTAPLSMPFTVAHEFAHRLAIAPENEVNFTAFLACTYSDDPSFNYSAYYLAYVYCHNALPQNMRNELNLKLSNEIKTDIEFVSNYYKQYEGKTNQIGNKVNDTYLKAMSQQSGVKSYGQVVDLLIAYYQQNPESN